MGQERGLTEVKLDDGTTTRLSNTSTRDASLRMTFEIATLENAKRQVARLEQPVRAATDRSFFSGELSATPAEGNTISLRLDLDIRRFHMAGYKREAGYLGLREIEVEISVGSGQIIQVSDPEYSPQLSGNWDQTSAPTVGAELSVPASPLKLSVQKPGTQGGRAALTKTRRYVMEASFSAANARFRILPELRDGHEELLNRIYNLSVLWEPGEDRSVALYIDPHNVWPANALGTIEPLERMLLIEHLRGRQKLLPIAHTLRKRMTVPMGDGK